MDVVYGLSRVHDRTRDRLILRNGSGPHVWEWADDEPKEEAVAAFASP